MKQKNLINAVTDSIRIAREEAELRITPISDHTTRITLNSLKAQEEGEQLNESLGLCRRDWPPPALQITELKGERILSFKKLDLILSPSPLTIRVLSREGKTLQNLTIDEKSGAISFSLGEAPVFGLGGGGQQFDRRGYFDFMDNGHRPGEYEIFGSRVPIPFLIGSDGWALFFHRPYNGAFDLRGEKGYFLPKKKIKNIKETLLPTDFFVTISSSPLQIMSEYTSLTGNTVMPPKWALGYMQSHRTLAGPEEILEVAQTFRLKELPCDVLIYLGTGYCPAGWNTGHGSLEFNPKTFDKSKEIIDRLHNLHFKIIPHVNNSPETLHGTFSEEVGPEAGEDHIVNYWKRHKPVFALGVDGWWPDDGDNLPIDSRLSRHLMYHQGSLSDRPGERPFSLHRTGHSGMQRYGGWVWSGDVNSLWDTLAAHISVGLNFSLSASPFWGVDIGGFDPTKELTGELYVRWFQFSSFCPIFRSHGRVWHTRLPWGWNTGELGPNEVVEGRKGTAAPDLDQLSNPQVEPICKQYLYLRYQLMPYTYTVVREAYDKSLPIMRPLWLHYPNDSLAVQCGDQYLWGRDILVAPVTKKGATNCKVYLPEGLWYDFWSNRKVKGKQTIIRYVDLSTMPLYVRAGAIIPFAPVRQWYDQPVDEPMTVRIYSGGDGEFILYEDDGVSLDYKKEQTTWTRFIWKDEERKLIIEPREKSASQDGSPRRFELLHLPEQVSKTVEYKSRRLEVTF